jgi:hypothetical protein
VALKRRYRWPLAVVLAWIFWTGLVLGGFGLSLILIGGAPAFVGSAVALVGGAMLVLGAGAAWERISSSRRGWRVNHKADTVRLWRPTGPEELALVEASGWREWPPRLPDQPIFYPVLNREYAVTIARDWNVKRSGIGYVTTFEVKQTFLDRYRFSRSAAAGFSSTGFRPRI